MPLDSHHEELIRHAYLKDRLLEDTQEEELGGEREEILNRNLRNQNTS
jgi:hypothetical protein